MLQITTCDLLGPHSRGKAQVPYMAMDHYRKSTPEAVPFTREIGLAEVECAESIYPAVKEAMRDGAPPPVYGAALVAQVLPVLAAVRAVARRPSGRMMLHPTGCRGSRPLGVAKLD